MSHPLKRLVAIDTETTGFSNSDKIVEIACIEIIDGEIGSSFHRWVNPTIGIPDRASHSPNLRRSHRQDWRKKLASATAIKQIKQ